MFYDFSGGDHLVAHLEVRAVDRAGNQSEAYRIDVDEEEPGGCAAAGGGGEVSLVIGSLVLGLLVGRRRRCA